MLDSSILLLTMEAMGEGVGVDVSVRELVDIIIAGSRFTDRNVHARCWLHCSNYRRSCAIGSNMFDVVNGDVVP